MIHIDDRTGSAELWPLFQLHRLGRGNQLGESGVPSTLARLPSADFCFTGNGPKGPVMVGIERKSIRHRRRDDNRQFRDVVSSITTGRLSGEQVPKLLEYYEFAYIIVEGIIRTNPHSGVLEERARGTWETVLSGNQPFMASRLWNTLESITWNAPIRIIHTSSQEQTVEEVYRLHQYFNAKEWERHHGHIGIHVSPESVSLTKASTVRRVAYALAGVGWEKSAAVDARFKSVADMVEAGPMEWAKLDGFGKVLSKRVVEELHGIFK